MAHEVSWVCRPVSVSAFFCRSLGTPWRAVSFADCEWSYQSFRMMPGPRADQGRVHRGRGAGHPLRGPDGGVHHHQGPDHPRGDPAAPRLMEGAPPTHPHPSPSLSVRRPLAPFTTDLDDRRGARAPGRDWIFGAVAAALAFARFARISSGGRHSIF